MPDRLKPTLITVFVLLLAAPLALAQGVAKRTDMPRVAQAPDIDGTIESDEWARAQRVDDLHQVVPVEFSAPSERTVWYLMYDDDALYVAAQAYDSQPDAIVARTMRQGASIDSDDSLNILIDTFNTKRSGFSFAMNPNSVRYDAIFTDGTRVSDDWEGIWRGAARLNSEGWAVEMAIPFRTLNFDPENDTWGLNLWREIARKDERIAWQSQNAEINPTASGEAIGFRNLSQGKGLDVTPSATSSWFNDRVVDESDTDFNPSVDINYKFRNAFNVLLTINTDFAAAEVDDRQLGLERFSLFFPEKRSFFLTDFDIFQFGGVPTGTGFNAAPTGVVSGTNGLAFFSRRIGLSATREPVDIIAGTKLSGRIGEYDFGTLYIRQDEFEGIEAKDLIVGRIVRNVLQESTIGAIATYGDPQTNEESSLVGLDFLYRNTRLTSNRSMESRWWVQRSDDDLADSDNLAWSASISFPSRQGWSGGAQYHVVEENFRPALGFANRTGVQLLGGELTYNHVLNKPRFLREIEGEIKVSRWEFLDTGRIQSQEIEIDLPKFRSVAGDFARFGVNLVKEGLLPGEQPLGRIGIDIPTGDYSFERYSAVMRTSGHRAFAFNFFVEDGDFYNGELFTISPEIEWRPNERFGIELELDYNRFDFPGVSVITRQVSLESEIAFNSRWSLTTLAQYDNISDDIGINARLRFNAEAGRDIWLVLNHNMVDDPIRDRFESTRTAAAIKVSYTFRY